MIEIQMKKHVVSGIIKTIWIFNAQLFHEEWRIMTDVHLVSVTLHGQFTIGIEQEK